MKFKQWFYTEVGTSTASVAIFSRPVFGGPQTRDWPPSIADTECLLGGEKKRRHKKHHYKKKED